MIDAGTLKATPAQRRKIEWMQPAQANRKRVLVARLAGLAATLQPVPVFRGFRLLRLARQTSLRLLMRNFLGTWRRALSSPR